MCTVHAHVLHPCAWAYTHMLIHGGSPQPPTLHKKIQGPSPNMNKVITHYMFWCKTLYVPNIKSIQNIWALHPIPQPPSKSFSAQFILQDNIWHITCLHAKTPIFPMQWQCKHKYVHIRHNMSKHKFECAAKISTTDKANYGKSEHIYVNMLSHMIT